VATLAAGKDPHDGDVRINVIGSTLAADFGPRDQDRPFQTPVPDPEATWHLRR